MYSLNIVANNKVFTTVFKPDQFMNVNKTFNHCDSIDLKLGNIRGLSIDSNYSLFNKNGYIRILLEDTTGQLYQVFEVNGKYCKHLNDSILEYCEETLYLDNVRPKSLKCYISNASINIKRVNWVSSVISREKSNQTLIDSLRKEQLTCIVNSINEYNKREGKLWIADITHISLKNFSDRKRHYGIDERFPTNGIEFYAGGIFDIEDENSLQSATNYNMASPYIESFGWRYQHGKNWMTRVKNQMGSGYCTAFAICSMLESQCRLYYNTDFDFDLSEQDLVYSYATDYPNAKSIDEIYRSGLDPTMALNSVIRHGIIDEPSQPFIDSAVYIIPSRPSGYYNVNITSHYSLSNFRNNIDILKDHLIHNGPVFSGIVGGGLTHAMALVGYHVIHEGDTIRPFKTVSDGGLFPSIIVPPGSPYIGKTYWVFKDNYGTDIEDRVDGYMYINFASYTNMYPVHYIESHANCNYFSDSEILCTDNDGDGYYFWGIGPKPAHCPSWVPDEPDGDDSDYTKGPMDVYGHLEIINPDDRENIYINSDSICSNRKFIYNHTIIQNGGCLTLQEHTTMYNNTTLTIQNGGKLVIDASILQNAKIIMESGSNLEIINGGSINICSNEEFSVPLGAKLNLVNGNINP